MDRRAVKLRTRPCPARDATPQRNFVIVAILGVTVRQGSLRPYPRRDLQQRRRDRRDDGPRGIGTHLARPPRTMVLAIFSIMHVIDNGGAVRGDQVVRPANLD